MTRFLTTAATALVLGTAAYAQDQSSVFSDTTFDAETNLNASELIGMRVYASEADINNEMTMAAGDETEWDDIGEINEILLTRDGEVQNVIVGVGGFLGIGEKDVAINMSELKFVSEDGEGDDFFLVVNANAAGVEEAPAYETEMSSADADQDAATMETEMADGSQDTDTMAVEGDAEVVAESPREMLTQPNIEREGYETTEVTELTADDLTGARVYGPNDEDVGEISELLMTNDGLIDQAVIDVGGLLGIGERPVAVTFDELQIMRAADGGDLRVYIDSSQEALEQQPEYKG
ncbi:PRC-barrel domain-containing protein [Yoonia sp. 2307UL14-13]|uniref:PRC-barrel domain-containing protein n=1 Tax=Yoonia sp. 2307UL14-13 TaxID=3126506 RepID=UPI0030AB6043